MTIYSSYNISTKELYGDVLSMFSGVPKELWIGVAVCFLTFVCLSAAGARALNQKYSSLWMTICAFLDQDNYPLDSTFVSALSTVVMIGMFFIYAFGTNCMGTDLVTIDKPIVLTSYDDIIEKNVTSIFVKALPEWERFKSATKGTKERTLFDRMKFAEINVDFLLRLQKTHLSQSTVTIGRPVLATAAALMGVGLPGLPSTARAYVAPDEQATKYTNVFIFSTRLRGTPLEKYLSRA